jgi:quinol monooxygenase YgiN
MSHPRPQLALFVDFFIQPHMINQWKEGHRPVWAGCAQEPNCLLFDIFEDPEDRGHFTVVEVWGATKQWFLEEQVTKDYYNELWQRTEHTYRKPRVVRFAERLGEGSSYRLRYLEVAKCMD